ncbi:tripartite motif-containing protein 16-like [Pangasianodon hypophthalmus]|uniref:tripartite motif-containing protein 16-like n=1 Tax=Pangasianodon hypophthalmus TaxID=310915 RepID=UPI00230810FE|nr:tripartite motif-containing protein 16-like [Pangasianodon hypophthalmus]
MAEASISVDQDQFICPVCLDLLKDPVGTPCGHCFCKVCINGFWDQEDLKGIYSCPQCRETFIPRPVLRRNNMLAEVVENLKETEHQAVSPAHCYAGPGDVECDSCIGRKHKALKSCLVCLASYCEDHLQPHYQSPAFKKHKLVEACAELQEKICSQHDKLIEIYCRTDQSFICYLCTMFEHKGHDTVVAEAERNEKQNELKEEQMKSQQRIQEKQKKVQEMKQTVDTIKKRSQAAVDDTERIFTELISSMEKRRSEVKKLIRAQEEAELSRAERLLEQLEQEIADHKRRVTELEQLSHTHNHIHFLQSFPSLCVSPGCEDSPSITVNQHLSFDGVRKSLSDLKKRVEEIYQEEINKIVLHDFSYLTLDPNTVHRKLILSENNRAVTHRKKKQKYSDHPERFDHWVQVLCKESVCGRCYWEVEWSGEDVYISVSYKEISRKGGSIECVFGRNSQSWSLRCSSSSVSFRHNDIQTELQGPASSRIGVFVDHSAGTLSFYNISDTMRLLHRVHTTFTQPLYAGFWIWSYDSTVRLCDPKLNVNESDEESD